MNRTSALNIHGLIDDLNDRANEAGVQVGSYGATTITVEELQRVLEYVDRLERGRETLSNLEMTHITGFNFHKFTYDFDRHRSIHVYRIGPGEAFVPQVEQVVGIDTYTFLDATFVGWEYMYLRVIDDRAVIIPSKMPPEHYEGTAQKHPKYGGRFIGAILGTVPKEYPRGQYEGV